ncbi:hypothetical protein GFS24_06925 [Chitinophaga sp. SYP-B3965]|uniref:hypothetical protein n=1 Tax=Chitinophaga sp. SYP-B3965 TaxID=2663120 RepID=UPI001299D45F|nr:hypothetical protein [Chitinophaga sp. SYP-B3965]MRG44840.1 hypothetical protein [Chitinophaga sp. SYP-B3965]
MYEIIPFKSVGPFEFKKSIDNYLSTYDMVFTPKTSEDDWNTYSYKDGALDIYTGDDLIITSIACRGDCFMKGEILTGMNINSFFSKFEIDKNKIKMEKVAFFDEREEDVYDIDDWGLQLWVDKFDEIITVFAAD